MSQWTHVAGLIRLDSMESVVKLPIKEKAGKMQEAIKKALGNTCDFESSLEETQACNVPQGSEGSLQYRVYRNSDEDEHALSWGYIAIYGDLRDFGKEDESEIVDWFQKSLERLNKPEGNKEPEEMSNYEKAEYILSVFMIREAILAVRVEFSHRTLLIWNDEQKKVDSIRRRNKEA